MNEQDLSKIIIDAAIEVHRTLGGPGLLESVYEESLAHELKLRECNVIRQQNIPIIYKDISLGNPLRLDIIVNKKVIVDCKAVTEFNSILEAQMLTYLRLTDLRLGLVINFGEKLPKTGIHRVVNGLLESKSHVNLTT